MWKIFERLFPPTSAFVEEPVDDSWRALSGCYVAQFENELKQIAKSLSDATRTISAQFYQRDCCVRFVDKNINDVAQVKVEGEMSAPVYATVRARLSDEEKKVFVQHLPRLKVYFE